MVMLCSWGCGRRGWPAEEARGIHLSQRTVFLSLFDGLVHGMMPIITECLLDPVLNSLNAMCVIVWVFVYACICV